MPTILLITALFVWMSRLVTVPFPLTQSLSHEGRGNPRITSSYKCKPLYTGYSAYRLFACLSL